MRHTIAIITAALLCMTGCRQQDSSSADNGTQTPAQRDFLQIAKDRYAVRSFKADPVGQEIIDKIIEAGRVAPTAINSQPQKIYVMKSADAMAKMNTLSPCMYGAPHCFVFCYDDNTVVKRGENGNYGEIDVTIVLTHMMLEAADLGIGTCPVGYFDGDGIKKAFNLPDNIHPILVMPFGYASDDAKPSDKHFSYRPKEETVTEL